LIERIDDKMTPALKYLINDGTIYFKIEESKAHKSFNIKLCKHDSYDLSDISISLPQDDSIASVLSLLDYNNHLALITDRETGALINIVSPDSLLCDIYNKETFNSKSSQILRL
jgi:hypothetical protein